MTRYSKYNIIYRLQKWIDTVPGQTFLNYGYSWGASIVILGALFKLTHLPGANIWLFLGMGTEVVVFFLSAFDRPFDKTDDGKEIPTHFQEDDEEIETVGINTKGNVACVDALKSLTEMLGKVNAQSQRLTRDSEEMENLNRTLTGITKVYEMQLKGASQQIGTIDQINEQTRKMAQQIEQLNKVYARMIEAMTVNMRVASPAVPTQPTTED